MAPLRSHGWRIRSGCRREAIDGALIALEGEGFAIRGQFEFREGPVEWCDRRLLARIHRYTLDRLRKEVEPVSPADFMRFLFVWHHHGPGIPGGRADGADSAVGPAGGLSGSGVGVGEPSAASAYEPIQQRMARPAMPYPGRWRGRGYIRRRIQVDAGLMRRTTCRWRWYSGRISRFIYRWRLVSPPRMPN